MKNERQARQALEAELAKERAAREALEAKMHKTSPAKSEDEDLFGDLGLGDTPKESEDDKPLTVKEWRELQRREREESERATKELNQRAAVVAEAQRAQEEYAKEIYPDFDEMAMRAKEVISNIGAIEEPWKRAKAVKLFDELRTAAANADKLGLDDYNGAMIVYEIGQLHPKHGRKAESNGAASEPEPKSNGGLTPEQMQRMDENTKRRASSASVADGGGRRTVAADDVGLNELARMTATQRLAFREKHPERYAKLMRG
jgi:hypothetical protein